MIGIKGEMKKNRREKKRKVWTGPKGKNLKGGTVQIEVRLDWDSHRRTDKRDRTGRGQETTGRRT